MTPAARVQAAIEIVDRIGAGQAAEMALTNWARASRYAGSKDRAAVRDLVYDVVRRWRSTAARGGGQDTGRARLIGLLRETGTDLDTIFGVDRYAPPALTASEMDAVTPPDGATALDLPDWLMPHFEASLGALAIDTAHSLRHRADTFLRVNTVKADLAEAARMLVSDGIETEPCALSLTALRVTSGARRVNNSQAYKTGLVELQDVASQAVVDELPLDRGQRVLDYCAGGGGKTLAMAARLQGGPITVHDSDSGRMADLPVRARRAGVTTQRFTPDMKDFDLVLCDVPCSGSGAWRRAPDGKWRLTSDRLAQLCALQARILTTCAELVRPGGTLAYVTCSLFEEENSRQIDAFLGVSTGWSFTKSKQFLPKDGGDGLFVAILHR